MENLENEKNLEKLEIILENIKSKNIRYYLIVPDIEVPNSSVYEIYRHASVLKSAGRNVTILTEEQTYKKPTWIDESILDVEHKHISNDIKISPQDVIIIPEIFTNIMEKIKPLQCQKILLLQSFDHAMHSLLPGIEYNMWGIFDVIVPSESAKEVFTNFFGESYNVKKYNIGIPEYFKKDDRLKKPIISYISRNSIDINRVVKLFYLKYPYLRFLTFQDLNNLDRKSFAEKLKDSFALLWIDNIATASTVPLEAMKAGTIPIAVLPNINHDYITNDNGLWTDNKLNLPMIIANTISKFLEGETDEIMENAMEETVKNYTDELCQSQLLKLYDEFLNERIETYKNYIDKYKKLETQ